MHESPALNGISEYGLTVAARDDGALDALIILIPPLFDEANRLRRTLVLTARALAALGHDSWMPDLPGQNDSLLPTEAVSLATWRDAMAHIVAQAQKPVILASWRGGALIDSDANVAGRWRMAPISGASVLRTLLRARIAGEREAGRDLTLDQLAELARAQVTELAGNRLSPTMVRELEQAVVADQGRLRTVQVGTAAGAIAGTPLWLRAEPGEDRAMADAMAADISVWSQSCVAG